MMEIKNRMIVDGEWTRNMSEKTREKLNKEGYKEMKTEIFVPEEDAFDYALERISLDEDLKQEFVEWFYSGNWIKED